MGSLSNLYISSSFQSLLHFGSDNTASVTLTEIEDGFGNGLGIYLNNSGSASFEGDVIVAGDLEISGAIDIEGAIIIRDNVYVTGSIFSSADISSSRVLSGEITASNVNITGTLTANKVVTLIESSSIIYSSGSNILGDETSDTQTLIGSVIMSGSSSLTGSMGITGNLNVGGAGTFGGSGSFIGDLTATGNISSSTLSGVGNVTLYSQSVDQRLSSLQVASASFENFTSSTYINFSTSVDSRLDFLEGPFSSSVSQEIKTLQLFTASVGLVTTASFQAFTASTNQRLNSLEFATSSLQTFTSSANIRLNNIESTTASLNSSVTQLNANTASQQTQINTLSSFTSSYATTGSNSFNGNQTITGSLILSSSAAIELSVIGNSTFSGSVRGVVIPLSIAASTASMDCSLGNFFTLTLASAATTRLVATNIQPGETITLKVLQPATTGSLTYPSNIKFGSALAYSASAIANATDIITFVSYDSTNLFAASTKNLV
jgi:hypothetical protein